MSDTKRWLLSGAALISYFLLVAVVLVLLKKNFEIENFGLRLELASIGSSSIVIAGVNVNMILGEGSSRAGPEKAKRLLFLFSFAAFIAILVFTATKVGGSDSVDKNRIATGMLFSTGVFAFFSLVGGIFDWWHSTILSPGPEHYRMRATALGSDLPLAIGLIFVLVLAIVGLSKLDDATLFIGGAIALEFSVFITSFVFIKFLIHD